MFPQTKITFLKRKQKRLFMGNYLECRTLCQLTKQVIFGGVKETSTMKRKSAWFLWLVRSPTAGVLGLFSLFPEHHLSFSLLPRTHSFLCLSLCQRALEMFLFLVRKAVTCLIFSFCLLQSSWPGTFQSHTKNKELATQEAPFPTPSIYAGGGYQTSEAKSGQGYCY